MKDTYYGGRKKFGTYERLTRTGIVYPHGTVATFTEGVHYQFGPYHRVGLGRWFRTWYAVDLQKQVSLLAERLPQ